MNESGILLLVVGVLLVTVFYLAHELEREKLGNKVKDRMKTLDELDADIEQARQELNDAVGQLDPSILHKYGGPIKIDPEQLARPDLDFSHLRVDAVGKLASQRSDTDPPKRPA